MSRNLRISTLTLGGCGFLFPLEDLRNLPFPCLRVLGSSLRVLRGYFVSRRTGLPLSYSLKHESLFCGPCLRSVRDPPFWLLLSSPCLRPLTVTVRAPHTSVVTCLSCLGFPSYLCNSLSGGTKSGYSWTTTPQPGPSRSILSQRRDK